MADNQYWRGYALGTLAALCASFFFIPYKEAMQTIPAEVFTAGMMLAAGLLHLPPLTVTPAARQVNRKALLAALVFAILSNLGNYGIGRALVEGEPAVIVTVLRMQVLMVMVLSAVFLRERVGPVLIIGGIVALCGFAVIATDGKEVSLSNLSSVLWALFAVLNLASVHVLIKGVIAYTHPLTFNLMRLLLCFLIMLPVPGVLPSLLALPPEAWLLIFGSALCGPTLSRVSGIFALVYIPVSRYIMFTLLIPIFALISGYFLFDRLPSAHALAGSGLILGGIMLPLLTGLRAGQTAPPPAEEAVAINTPRP